MTKPTRKAGPTAAGTFVTRKTFNDYYFAVVVIDHCPHVYKPRDPAAVGGYIDNPTLGEWVSLSWHGTYEAAMKKKIQCQNHGRFDVDIVPVVPMDQA